VDYEGKVCTPYNFDFHSSQGCELLQRIHAMFGFLSTDTRQPLPPDTVEERMDGSRCLQLANLEVVFTPIRIHSPYALTARIWCYWAIGLAIVVVYMRLRLKRIMLLLSYRRRSTLKGTGFKSRNNQTRPSCMGWT